MAATETATALNACEFCGKPNKAPQGKKAHERKCPENPNYVKPKALAAAEERERQKAENPDNICRECEAEGTHRQFETMGALSSHRLKTHGIESLSAGLNRNRKHHGKRAKPQAQQALTLVIQNNGQPTPRSLRKQLQVEANNRQDLLAMVKVVYPNGVPTENDDQLDQFLGFVFSTADMLASR